METRGNLRGCLSMATCVLVWSLLLYEVGGINEDIPDHNSSCGEPNTVGVNNQDCNYGCWMGESGCDPCASCPESHKCWEFCRHYLDDLDWIRQEDTTVEFSKLSSNSLDKEINSLDKDGTSDLITNNVSTKTVIALIASGLLVFVLCALLICYVVKRKTNLRRTNLPEGSNDSSTDTSDDPLLGPEPDTTRVGKVQSMETSFSVVSEVSEQQYRRREGKEDQDMQSVNGLIEGMNAETLSSEQNENGHRGNEDLKGGMWSIKHQVHGATGQEKEQSRETSLSEVCEVSEPQSRSLEENEDQGTQSMIAQIVETHVETLSSEKRKSCHKSKEDLEGGMLSIKDQETGAKYNNIKMKEDEMCDKWQRTNVASPVRERLAEEDTVSEATEQNSNLRFSIHCGETISTDTSNHSGQESTHVKEECVHGDIAPSSNIAVHANPRPGFDICINEPASWIKLTNSFNGYNNSQKPVKNTYPQEDRQSQASAGAEVGQEVQIEEQEEIKQFHPSKQSLIYDQLKKIDWVMGYISAGESIDVHVNLGSLDPRTVEQQLADITGADITKFHARQNKQPEFDCSL